MDKHEFLLEQWKMASTLHLHMDDMIWRRFDYLIGLNVVLLSALGYVWHIETEAWLKLLASLLLPSVGVFLSNKWSRMHTRAQLYHSLRKVQAENAENILVNQLGLEHRLIAEREASCTVYGATPDDLPDKIKRDIGHSRWGETHTLDIVFKLSRWLERLWIVLLVLSLLAIAARLWRMSVIPAWFTSPI